MAEYLRTDKGDNVIVLSPLEARGLLALVVKNVDALLSEPSTASARRERIGTPSAVKAAKDAYEVLHDAATKP